MASKSGSSDICFEGKLPVCLLAYYPHCELKRSILDEAVYVPLKSVMRGFRVWGMADARNGYIYNFNVYTGATGNREMVLGEKAVLTLAEFVKGRHHQLYFDNYFASITLLTKLLSEGTYRCGMIRTNTKQYPSKISVEAQRFQHGESAFRQSGNLVATRLER